MISLTSACHYATNDLQCRKSMARIKYVLHERRRAAQEAHALVEAEKQRPEEPVMTRPAPSFFESVEPVAPTAA